MLQLLHSLRKGLPEDVSASLENRELEPRTNAFDLVITVVAAGKELDGREVPVVGTGPGSLRGYMRAN